MTDSANEPMGDSLGYCRSGCARNRGYRPAAQRNQPTQTLKGFHSSAVCRTPSAFIDNPPPKPGCAARPGALLLKSLGLSLTPQKSKTLRSKLWVNTSAWHGVRRVPPPTKPIGGTGRNRRNVGLTPKAICCRHFVAGKRWCNSSFYMDIRLWGHRNLWC